jgi:hypothetical protein
LIVKTLSPTMTSRLKLLGTALTSAAGGALLHWQLNKPPKQVIYLVPNWHHDTLHAIWGNRSASCVRRGPCLKQDAYFAYQFDDWNHHSYRTIEPSQRHLLNGKNGIWFNGGYYSLPDELQWDLAKNEI